MIKNHIAYSSVNEWKFTVTKAQESFLWDEQGRKLIDFTSGWNVTNAGWNHPEITDALRHQIDKNLYAPMWANDPIQDAYAQALCNAFPSELDTVCRATGGSEANEKAIKIARAATDRKKIIGIKDSYHGQSYAAMSIGYRPEYVKSISPMVPEFIQLTFPSVWTSTLSETETLEQFLASLESELRNNDVAAFITEPGIITGWGHTLVAPEGYLTAVRKLTEKYGTLLIVDEVGTGFSRTGKLFAIEHEGVVPDLVTLAKGISNGAAAIGAVVGKKSVIEPTLGSTTLVSTFGWTPLACAAAYKNLEIHTRDNLAQHAVDKGNWLTTELKRRLVNHPKVGDIRGPGLEIGLVLVTDRQSNEADGKYAKQVISEAFKRGLHISYGDEGSIQLMPPLTISQSVLSEGLDILGAVLEAV